MLYSLGYYSNLNFNLYLSEVASERCKAGIGITTRLTGQDFPKSALPGTDDIDKRGVPSIGFLVGRGQYGNCLIED